MRILAVNSFAVWRGIPGAVERVFRLLRPGGRFVIVHQPRGRHATDTAARQFAAETTVLLGRVGFRIAETEYLPLSPLVAGIVAERT